MEFSNNQAQFSDDYVEAWGARVKPIDHSPGPVGQHALAVPEIVGAVLQFAVAGNGFPRPYCHRWLRDCSLVSRVWAHEALRILWSSNDYRLRTAWRKVCFPDSTKHRSLLKRLSDLPRDRQEYYAPKISHMREWSTPEVWSPSNADVEFSSLRHLELFFDDDADFLLKLNAPQLRSLKLSVWMRHEPSRDSAKVTNFWEQVQLLYPHLEYIGFERSPAGSCSEAVFQFMTSGHLNRFPKLRSLKIPKRKWPEKTIDSLQILHDVAIHPSLETLHFQCEMPFYDKHNQRLFRFLESTHHPLFTNLRSIILIHVPLSVYNALVQVMPSLVDIEACGILLDAPYIQIPTSSALEKLDIRICSCFVRDEPYPHAPQGPLITTPWLMDVARDKSSLRHLEINTKWDTSDMITPDTLNDQMIEEFASLLPRLEILFLDRDVEVAGQELDIHLTPKMRQTIVDKLPNAQFLLFGRDCQDAWISEGQRKNPTFWKFARHVATERWQLRGLKRPRQPGSRHRLR